ncbi:MAG: hypothetical protein M0T79_09760 [Actinomycetota bacterium]|nr:hypothetical protein [Actinomycetota bacterium]
MTSRSRTPTMALLAEAALVNAIALLVLKRLAAHPLPTLVVFALAMAVTVTVFARLIARGFRRVTTRPTYRDQEEGQ